MKATLWLWCLFALLPATAQQANEVDLERIINDFFPVQDEDFNYEELYETYAQLLASPLDLNTVSAEQLRTLMVLNETQIIDFLAFRADVGPFLSIYELQAIPSFSENQVQALCVFFQVQDSKQTGWRGLANRVLHEKNNYLVSRLERTMEEKAGEKSTASTALRFQGDALKWYNRFRVSAPNDFSLGITLEKDAGEALSWKGSSGGFDFYSWHMQVQQKGALKNALLGDFQAQFGQGLTLGSGFGMGKGSETVTSIRRSNLGFTPYTSALEAGFFRGAATSVAFNEAITLHTFYSKMKRDGSINAESAETPPSVSSLFASGQHRTSSELANRHNINEQNAGAVLQFTRNTLDAGLLFVSTTFSVPILKKPNLYNQFSFTGTNNQNIGAYLNFSSRGINFFAEGTQTLGAGRAAVAGVLTSINQHLDMALHARYFARDFHSFYSNALSENSTPQNEQGIYWGLKYRWAKRHILAGYVDLFRFPWLKFRTYQPSNGSEWLMRYTFVPLKRTTLYVQARQEVKMRNSDSETAFFNVSKATKTNLWINLDHQISPQWDWRTRGQWVHFSSSGTATRGAAIAQEISYAFGRLSLTGRVTLFDTDGFDTRLYFYERDAWLAFSIPALQGEGSRHYALLQYKLNDSVHLWFRWAATRYPGREALGSGADAIQGDTRNDIKVQIRVRL